MEKARNFRDLIVWQKAHFLVLNIYQVTATFPKEERYGLVSQVRRAAVSVPANIAEGFTKEGPKNKLYFYNISEASLEELKYYLILAKDLEYATSIETYWSLAGEVGALLAKYIAAVKASL